MFSVNFCWQLDVILAHDDVFVFVFVFFFFFESSQIQIYLRHIPSSSVTIIKIKEKFLISLSSIILETC